MNMGPQPTWHLFWTTWQFRPVWTLAVVVLLLAYVAGLRAARRHGRRGAHPVRVATFVAGLVVLLWSVSSAVDAFAMTRFWIHMVEHLLLIMVVPMLLVLGSPLGVLRSSLADPGRFDRVIRSRPIAFLTHPVTTFLIYAGVIVGTHLTGFMDAMAQHMWLMTGEQLLYLGAGFLYWLPLIGREPIRWELPGIAKILLTLLGMAPDTVVGLVLMQATTNLMPVYMAGRGMGASFALDDQNLGGSIMWFFGDGLMMVAGVFLMIDLIAHPRANQTMGAWLEGVRRSSMADHVHATGGDFETADADDEAAHEAYNRMLEHLNQQER